jgi:amino acid transporter
MNFSNLFRKKSIEQIKADAESGVGDHDPSMTTQEPHLRRSLGLVDLTALGIAAIIGAGIFAMVGQASADGGPAVILLFIIVAIACGLSALCYAEFASKVPIAGSAYTYSYASFGELFAWIIGWDLLVEYAIGNIAVAISWSDYFTGLLKGYKINIPDYLTMDYLSASRGFEQVQGLMSQGASLDVMNSIVQANSSADKIALIEKASLTPLKDDLTGISAQLLEAYNAWLTAPKVGGLRIIADLPALAIVFIITALVYIGIKESKTASNIMVALKLGIILFVIAIGAFYVSPSNWSPFMPNGFEGVMKGVAAVFFAYIGFDALSTTAEECKDPHKDLPRSMILSLLICTALYCTLALILTGMVSYSSFQGVGDPLAFVFGSKGGVNIPWIEGIVAIGAVIAIATVLLVFQLGQPRIWMAMSRDGLLPKIFSDLHPRFKTPWFSTIITGLLVATPALFMNLTEVTGLTSIGTMFAFVLVCGGVLVKDKEFGTENRYVPYINGQFIVPVLFVGVWVYLFLWQRQVLSGLFDMSGGFTEFRHKIPFFIFIIVALVMTVLSFLKRLSLIPTLGLLSCAYLMTGLEITNWERFGIWLLIGIVIYFFYGYSHSKLHKAET